MVLTQMRRQSIAGIFALLVQAVHLSTRQPRIVLQWPWSLQHAIPEKADREPVRIEQVVAGFAKHRVAYSTPYREGCQNTI